MNTATIIRNKQYRDRLVKIASKLDKTVMIFILLFIIGMLSGIIITFVAIIYGVYRIYRLRQSIVNKI